MTKDTGELKVLLSKTALAAMGNGLGLPQFLAEPKKQYLALGAEISERWRKQKEERTTEITDSVDLDPYEEQKIQIVRAAIEVYRERFPDDPRQPILD
jgi:hypothetical protein